MRTLIIAVGLTIALPAAARTIYPELMAVYEVEGASCANGPSSAQVRAACRKQASAARQLRAGGYRLKLDDDGRYRWQ